jgi:hypothetical protein
MGDSAAELDDILNSALDELDEEEEEEEKKAPPITTTAAPGGLKGAAVSVPSSSSSSATRGSSLAGAAASSVSGAGAGPKSSSSSSGGGGGTPSSSSGGGGDEGDEEEDEERELQEAIAKTIGLLGKLDAPAGEGGEGDCGGAGADGMFDEAFLSKLVEEFDRLGGGGGGGDGGGGDGSGGGGESMVDGMVKQLLAKDLMYPPLKEVTKQFPAWLEAHRGKTEAAAYERCVPFCPSSGLLTALLLVVVAGGVCVDSTQAG